MESCEKNSGTERGRDHTPRKTRGGKREEPDPALGPTQGAHGVGCLEAAPRQKPQGDESVSLDTGDKECWATAYLFRKGRENRARQGSGGWRVWPGEATTSPRLDSEPTLPREEPTPQPKGHVGGAREGRVPSAAADASFRSQRTGQRQ